MSNPEPLSNDSARPDARRRRAALSITAILVALLGVYLTAAVAEAAPQSSSILARGSTTSVDKFNINVKVKNSTLTGTISWTQDGQKFTAQPVCYATTVDPSGEDPSTGTVVGRISGTNTLAVFSVSDDGPDDYLSLQLVPDDNTCPSGAATEPVKGTVIIT